MCVLVCGGGARTRVALLSQHVTRMRESVLLFVVSLAPPHFSTFSHKRSDFRGKKKVTEHKMRILIFSRVFI